MKNLFTFDEFITPKFITAVYWLMIIFFVFIGINSMSIAYNPYYGSSMTFPSFLRGILVIIVGVVFSRISCEIMVIFFRIEEHLRHIRNK